MRKKSRAARKNATTRADDSSENAAPQLSPDAAELLRLLTKARASPRARKRIRPDEKVPTELNARERELIVQHSFAEPELTDRLRVVPTPGEPPAYRFTLDELDELLGYVAAEANYAKNKKLQQEWDRLFARLTDVLEAYTDEEV